MLNIISCEFLEEIIYNLFLNEGREIYNENGTFNRFQIDDTDYDNLSIYEAQKKALNNIKDQKGVEYKNLENSYENIVIIWNYIYNYYYVTKIQIYIGLALYNS